jgi:hypothetical protein
MCITQLDKEAWAVNTRNHLRARVRRGPEGAWDNVGSHRPEYTGLALS